MVPDQQSSLPNVESSEKVFWTSLCWKPGNGKTKQGLFTESSTDSLKLLPRLTFRINFTTAPEMSNGSKIHYFLEGHEVSHRSQVVL